MLVEFSQKNFQLEDKEKPTRRPGTILVYGAMHISITIYGNTVKINAPFNVGVSPSIRDEGKYK